MIIASVSGIAIAQECFVEPTAFESFVARTSVVLEINEPVGWIVSTDATPAIALLLAGSARKRARKFRRRELRADPANSNAGQGRLHADGAEVAAAIEDVAGVEDAVTALKAEAGAPWRVQGTGSCWRPARCAAAHVWHAVGGRGAAACLMPISIQLHRKPAFSEA